MSTPQNLPALIKEMQERARELYEDELCCLDESCKKQRQVVAEYDNLVTDTANATLEYVKGVVEDELKEINGEGSVFDEFAQNIIARLTSNPQ